MGTVGLAQRLQTLGWHECLWALGLFSAAQQTSTWNAPRNFNKRAMLPPPQTWYMCGMPCNLLLFITTLGNGYLGSCIDEECSELRYLV
ncbi:hypothetical protein NL676_029957 [Syzygium grande]|nr:hypothetical protein NL676_029957 [Syzygium grande]